MKSLYESYRRVALIACCVLGACRVAGTDGAESGGNARNGAGGAGGGAASAAIEPRGGSAAVGGKHSGGASAAGARSVEADGAGQAGAGNEAGYAEGGDGGTGSQPTPLDPATAECAVDGGVDGGCISNCTNESANCAVESFQFACEFDQFHDMPAPLACGQTVTVGVANCGECGEVAVKLYFDGSHCWQGIPDCKLDYTGELVDPHAPLP